MIKHLRGIPRRPLRRLGAALVAAQLVAGCGQDPPEVAEAVQTEHAPARPAYCPPTGPCLEREQAPVLLRTDLDHRLILRGWGLTPGVTVRIEDKALTPTLREDGALAVKVPKATVGDDTTITVDAGEAGKASLQVAVSPTVKDVSTITKEGRYGLALVGGGFGASGSVTFTASGVFPAKVWSWSPARIEVEVPDGAWGGKAGITVTRRLVLDGEDRGPLRAVVATPELQPIISSVDCTKPRNESCAISGHGFGSGYTVQVNGVPITKGTFKPDSAVFPLPATVVPGPLQIQVVQAGGGKSNIAKGELLAWSKLRHAGVRFPATPGSYFRDSGVWWLLVHNPTSLFNGLVAYDEKGLGAVRCKLTGDIDEPDVAPNFAAVTADHRAWLLSSPPAGAGSKDAAVYWCVPAGAKAGDPAKVAAYLDTDLVDPPLHGLAASGEDLFVLLGDTTTKQERLYRLSIQAVPMKATFVQSVQGSGRLAGGGGQVYLVREPGSSGPFMRLVGGKLVAITNPWINTLKAPPPARVTDKGELQLVVAQGDGSTIVRSYDPGKSSWTDAVKVPAKVGQVRSALQHQGAWWVLGRTDAAGGGDSLHAWDSKDGKAWRRLYADLTRVGDCAATVGPALMMSSGKDMPAAAWEVKAPGCVQGAVNTHLGKVGVASRELLEP